MQLACEEAKQRAALCCKSESTGQCKHEHARAQIVWYTNAGARALNESEDPEGKEIEQETQNRGGGDKIGSGEKHQGTCDSRKGTIWVFPP